VRSGTSCSTSGCTIYGCRGLDRPCGRVDVPERVDRARDWR
jgi:hypothetical protein